MATLALAVAAGATVGCSTGKPTPARIKSEYVEPDLSGRTIYLTAARDEARPVDLKSYRIGERAECFVGETMAEVRKYTAGDRVVRAVVTVDLNQTCGISRPKVSSRAGISPGSEVVPTEKSPCKSGPLSYLRIPAGRTLAVSGGFEEQGKTYYLLAIETAEGTLFLATDKAGYLKGPPYAAWRDSRAGSVVTQVGIPLKTVEITDPMAFDVPVVRYETEEVVLSDSINFVHYELIYAGASEDHRGRSWHLAYKEYRRNPTGSPIYTKRLDYDEVGEPIELLGMKIQIHDVSPSRLVYTIISD